MNWYGSVRRKYLILTLGSDEVLSAVCAISEFKELSEPTMMPCVSWNGMCSQPRFANGVRPCHGGWGGIEDLLPLSESVNPGNDERYNSKAEGCKSSAEYMDISASKFIEPSESPSA